MKTRVDIIRYLEGLADEQYQARRESRCGKAKKGIARLLWNIYYRSYEDIEEFQYRRSNDWRFSRSVSKRTENPQLIEFREWWQIRHSIYLLTSLMLWVILIPMIIYYISMGNAPEVGITRRNKVYFGLVVILVSTNSKYVKRLYKTNVSRPTFLSGGLKRYELCRCFTITCEGISRNGE